MLQVNKQTITEKSLQKFYTSIENDYKVKFVCINDNFLYKRAIESLVKKIGLIGNIAKEFMETVSMCIPIPLIGGVVILPYHKNDSTISIENRFGTAVHELQHLIDAKKNGLSKWYKMYVSNSTFRAIYEARAYSAELETLAMMYHLDNGISKSINEKLYMLSDDDIKLISMQINNTVKNLKDAPSFPASKYFASHIC